MKRRSFLPVASVLGCASASATVSASCKTKIRVGQIGLAHGHASKIAVYRQSDDYEVVGIVEPDVVLRERVAVQPAFRDLSFLTQEQLLNDSGLDVVLVETAPKDSLAIAEACLQAGKHIHLDKPAGQSLSHFKRILELAESKQLAVQMGYMYRYNPAILLLRTMLADGLLGDIFEVHAVMSKVLSPADRQSLSAYSGGMMFELGCHLIDLIVHLIGEPQRVSPFRQHASRLPDNLVDNMLSVLEYPTAIASVKSSAQEVEGFARRHMVFCGSKGTFHIQPLDSPSVKLALTQRRGTYVAGYQDIKLPNFDRYVADAADMAKIVRGEKANEFSYLHDFMVQRTVLKASGLAEA